MSDVMQYTPEWRERYGTPFPTLLPWARDLEVELVAADVADWRGAWHPHPSNIALVVQKFLADRGVVVPE